MEEGVLAQIVQLLAKMPSMLMVIHHKVRLLTSSRDHVVHTQDE